MLIRNRFNSDDFTNRFMTISKTRGARMHTCVIANCVTLSMRKLPRNAELKCFFPVLIEFERAI